MDTHASGLCNWWCSNLLPHFNTSVPRLRTVEVLNTETLQWSTAADLPQPLAFAPAMVCCDHIHILDKFTMYTFSKSIFPPIPEQKSFLTSVDIFLSLAPATIRAVPVHRAVVPCCLVGMGGNSSVHLLSLLSPVRLYSWLVRVSQCKLSPISVRKLLTTTDGKNSTGLFKSQNYLAVLIV